MTPLDAMPQAAAPPQARPSEPLLCVRRLSTCFSTPDGMVQAIQAVENASNLGGLRLQRCGGEQHQTEGPIES